MLLKLMNDPSELERGGKKHRACRATTTRLKGEIINYFL